MPLLALTGMPRQLLDRNSSCACALQVPMYLLDMTLDAQHEDRHEKVETENRYFFGGVDMARKTRRVLGSLQKACDLKKSLYTRHTDVHAEHDSALRISGWLVKAGVQKGPVGGWKNRFCVLDGNVLSYYQPRNSVDIDSCEEQEEHAVGIAMQALQAGVGQAEDEESMELRGVIPLQEVTVHAVGPRDIKIDARWVKEGYTCCFGAHMRMRVAALCTCQAVPGSCGDCAQRHCQAARVAVRAISPTGRSDNPPCRRNIPRRVARPCSKGPIPSCFILFLRLALRL